jgi:hypothetical protein
MADVILLFCAALLALGGTAAMALTVRYGRRRQALERHARPARLRRELDEINERIRQVNQAATDADLDRLEQPEEQQ